MAPVRVAARGRGWAAQGVERRVDHFRLARPMGKDRIVFSKVDASGNIWMAEVK